MASKADVQRVLASVNRATDLAFFFDALTSPDWIEALKEADLFSSPPREEAEGGYVRYPSWAASRYLARMAHLAPESVLSVIEQLPESGNPRVHEDITQAAASMPAAFARGLVPQIRHWIETDTHLLLLPERAVELAEHLAAAGAGDEALALAQSLFSLTVEDDAIGQQVRARISDHDFVEFLQQLVGPLTTASGLSALRLLVELLDEALSERYGDDPVASERFDDASTIWRGDISDRAEGDSRFQPVLNALVDAVLFAADALSDSELGKMFDILRHARAPVFRRVELQLVAELRTPASSTIVARLLVDRVQLCDYSLELEYLRALRAAASQLSPEARRKLTKWIRLGPIRRKFLAKRFGDEWDSYLTTWQARRLAALGDATPQGDREWAASIVSQVDDAALVPVRPAAVTTWIGPTSPKSFEDLSKMSVDELVTYLRDWTPTGEWAGPSPEGLGRALSAAIILHPMRFSRSASAFIGLDPVYTRSVLAGFRDALKEGRRISWGPVLDMCDWVVDQPVGTLHADWVRQDRDPGWDWTWTEIARLLSEGLTERANRIPRSIAGRARLLALRLVDHRDPSPESEAQYGGSNMDPSTLSLNTTRGTATHTLIRLAWWEKQILGRKRLHRDVNAALERLATPDEEPSLAVHSVFGRWFGTLTWLDPDWTSSLVDRIFPLATDSESFWWAAWSSFIVFDRPTLSAHRMLQERYATAIDRLGSQSESPYFHAGRTHAEALASHILAYTAWGTEGNPDAGLLGRLFDGPDPGRVEFVKQAGRLLRDHGIELKPPIVEALQRLWERRRSIAAVTLGDGMRGEIAQFSWWCGASVLDVRWWLAELLWVVKNVPRLDASFVVMEALPDGARVDALSAVRVLDAISHMRADPWAIPRHPQEVAEVLTIALSSVGEAHREAVRLIHDLGARELANFSRLLP